MKSEQQSRVLQEAEQILLNLKKHDAKDVLFDTAWELLAQAFTLEEPNDESKAYLLPLFAALATAHSIDELCALCFDIGRAYQRDHENDRG